MIDNRELFDFMMANIKDAGSQNGLNPPQAFARWFAEMYFESAQDFFVSDGPGDAKVDLFLTSGHGTDRVDCILNTKFTNKYNSTAPVAFYNEVTAFSQAFKNAGNRARYLKNVVRPDLRPRYNKLFKSFDAGTARLFFVTNHKRNDVQLKAIGKASDIVVFHLEDLLQFIQDFTENAMPITKPLVLTGINTVLSASKEDSSVPTSIVFARLTDFIRYMDDDIFQLLFARNVRLSLGKTRVNEEIQETFEDHPGEFAFSNNGITLLCESAKHDPATQEIRITNPRVVNGSQTLHSVYDAEKHSKTARVMVRLIQIAPRSASELPSEAKKRKDIIHKISIRSNFQNPIKKWNLVSNDEFQLSLARHFWRHKLFYERRQNEWKDRASELKNVGIKKGPRLTKLCQLIASYHWKHEFLGPAVAMGSGGSIFDPSSYDTINQTSPMLAHQLFLLDGIIDLCVRELAEQKQYVRNLARFMKYALFAMVVRSLQTSTVKWEKEEFTSYLETQSEAPRSEWRTLVGHAAKAINDGYMKEAKQYNKKFGKPLSYANFFKAYKPVGRLLSKPLNKTMKSVGRRVVA